MPAAPHKNIVGDSIVGPGVNLGAGADLANYRLDGQAITIPRGDHSGVRLETGRTKFGSVLGANVQIGCHCVLSPGTIVGQHTSICSGVVLRPGVYQAGVFIKLRQDTEIVPRR